MHGASAARGADLRLALPALCGWLAAAVLVGAPSAASWAAAAAGGLLGGLAAWAAVAGERARRRGAPRAGAGILSIVSIGVVALSVALLAPARTPAVVAEALAAGGSVVGVIALQQTAAGELASVDAVLERVERPTAPGAPAVAVVMRVPVRVLGLDAGRRLPVGTRLDGRFRLIPLEAGDDRVALARPMGQPNPVGLPPPLIGGADALRERFLALAAQLPGEGAALLPGLSIGDTAAVGDELDAAMKRSSLSHLTAVSGANCAIVVGLVLGVGALLRWRRPVRIGVALVMLGGFVLLVTPEPSVVRAAVMAAVVLLAVASGRPARGLPVLAAAVLGIVVLDPWTAREYGFVLSVLATGALLVLAGPLAERLATVMPRAIALWLAVPLAAQLVCQPVLVLLAPEIPLAGVVANVLAAPAAPVATIVGMIACLLAPVLPPLALLVAAIAWLPASWIAGVAQVASGIPGTVVPWPEGAGGALLLAVLVVGGMLAAGIPHPLARRRVRGRLALATVALLVAVMGATAGVAALRGLSRPADWAIAQCDIGQGDAVLVRSAGRVALTDTGADPELLEACLRVLGVERIDLLVLTHFDHDHVGAVEVVVGRVAVAIVGPTDGARDEAIIEALREGGARVETVAAGASGSIGDYGWRTLWPPGHRGVEPGNDASLVLEWRGADDCGCPSMLALGDLGASAQQSMRTRVRLAPVDVVKVSHHGSNDQNPELYAEVRAAIGLIGVGADNTYGHPTAEAIDAVTDAGGTVLRSDERGLALIAPSGAEEGWRTWSERGPAPAERAGSGAGGRSGAEASAGSESHAASVAPARLERAPATRASPRFRPPLSTMSTRSEEDHGSPIARQALGESRGEDPAAAVARDPPGTGHPRQRPRELPRRSGQPPAAGRPPRT